MANPEQAAKVLVAKVMEARGIKMDLRNPNTTVNIDDNGQVTINQVTKETVREDGKDVEKIVQTKNIQAVMIGDQMFIAAETTDGDGNTIPLTQDYRFEMPENDVTVRVVVVNLEEYKPFNLTASQLNPTSAVLMFNWETTEPVQLFDFYISQGDKIIYSGMISSSSICISTMETPVPGSYQYTWGVRSRDESGDPIGEWAYSEAALEIQGTQGIETIKINGEDASGKPVKLLWNNQIYIIRGDKIYTITGQLVK